MKLVPARSGLVYSLLASLGYAAKLNSDCLGDNLVISIPLQDEKMANILDLSAGNCTHDNIPGGIEDAIVFDEDENLGKLSIPIEECGLKEELYKDPKTELRSKEQFYMPTANVTLGQEHDGVDLLFKQYYIAAECGFRTTYDVEFKYNVEYDEDEEEDCQMIDGICVFPAWHADAEFVIVEFDSDEYDEEAEEDEDKVRRPGDDIFLAIQASKVPKDYDWSVTKCTVTSELGTELDMINPGEVNGTCALDDINLKAGYENGEFRFSHTIFMLDNPKKSTYSLKCEIELCYKDAEDSVCKVAGQVCGCAAGYHQNDDGECIENECECENGVAARHWECVNDGDDTCVSCDKNYYLKEEDMSCQLEMYSFSSHTFSVCGSSGQNGPSLANCKSSYDADWADDEDFFDVNGGIQQWTVPKTGTYEIEAYGARGGGSSYYGRGVIYKGDFSLKMGDKIDILVGQMGGWGGYAGSGGGGTFVVKTDGSVLVVAGGGGGQQYGHSSVQYADAQYGSSSGRQGGPTGGAGGTSGNGGKQASNNGASGGGGYSGDGGKGSWGTGGKSFKNGGKGGDTSSYAQCVGGFGGGGGTHGSSGGGGGGGGYSGGGGGDHNPSNGGGGGSYCSGSNKYGKSVNNGNTGHGKVIIKFKQAARFGILTEADDNQGVKVRTAPYSWYNSEGMLIESDFKRSDEDKADQFDGNTSA